MQLTRDFSLEELTATATGLGNTPGACEEQKLLYLCAYLLQPVRDRWGRMNVTSGYRSRSVNERVGGSTTSQHLVGEAADFVPAEAGIDEVFCWITEESGLAYGQAINESRGGRRWIHLSLVRRGRPNRETLVYDGVTFRSFEARQ